ncbi:MAG: response regulator [Pararobbsia sp.]
MKFGCGGTEPPVRRARRAGGGRSHECRAFRRQASRDDIHSRRRAAQRHDAVCSRSDPLNPETNPQDAELQAGALRRCWVVDDNVDACEGTAMLVDFAGYVVELAFDGPVAIEKAERFRPHVVLLDIAMPRHERL